MTYNFSEEEYKEYKMLKENVDKLSRMVLYGDGTRTYYSIITKDEAMKSLVMEIEQKRKEYDKLYNKVRTFAYMNAYSQKLILKKGFILDYFFDDEKEVTK